VRTRDLHNKIVLHWRGHVVAWVTKEYWRLYASASGHSPNGPTDTSSKHSSSLMHCLLSLSAALQQLGVVSLGPQKRDEITKGALYGLVETLVDPAAKRVSETWHCSNLHFIREMLDTWDPTWSQATGTWQTRLKELTSVCLAASDNPNGLTFPPRITRASELNHRTLTYLRGPRYFWGSCSRHGLEQSIRLLLYCATASLQAGRSTVLLSMW
jgi:hypothetical protein